MTDTSVKENKTTDTLIELETIIADKGLKDTGITIQIALFAIASLIWLLLKTITINKNSLDAIYLLFLFTLSFTTTIAILAPDFKHGFIFKYKKCFKFTFTRKSTSYNATQFFYNPLTLLLYAIFYYTLLCIPLCGNCLITNKLVLTSIYLYLQISFFSVILILGSIMFKELNGFRNSYFKYFRYYILFFSISCSALTGYAIIYENKDCVLKFGKDTPYIEIAFIITAIVFLVHYLFNIITKRQMLDNLLLIKKLFLTGNYEEKWIINKLKESILSDERVIKTAINYINNFDNSSGTKKLNKDLDYMEQNKSKISTDPEERKKFLTIFSEIDLFRSHVIESSKSFDECINQLSFLSFAIHNNPIHYPISVKYDYKYNNIYLKKLKEQLHNKQQEELPIYIYSYSIDRTVKSLLVAAGYETDSNEKNTSSNVNTLFYFLRHGTFTSNNEEELKNYKEKINDLINKLHNNDNVKEQLRECSILIKNLCYYINSISSDLNETDRNAINDINNINLIESNSVEIEKKLKMIITTIDKIISNLEDLPF